MASGSSSSWRTRDVLAGASAFVVAALSSLFRVRLTRDVRLWGGGRLKEGTFVRIYRAERGRVRVAGKGLTVLKEDEWEVVVPDTVPEWMSQGQR